jgi:SAM-dependent methyltransferase
MSVPPDERDAWVDLVFELDALPEDGPDLPRGGVPYVPCSVDALLRVVDRAPVRATDVFVDLGSGIGRAAALVHLLTGAGAIGVEIQPELVAAADRLAARLRAPRVSFVEGDAAALSPGMSIGTVFFLYCPFGGERLATVLAHLEAIARTREVRVCSLDLPLPRCPWLVPLDAEDASDLAIHRSAPLDVGAASRIA